MSTTCCTECCRPLSRLNYFPRQLVTAEDMRTEQEYFLDRMRRRNRLLHGFGVVCGLDVRPKEDEAREVPDRPDPPDSTNAAGTVPAPVQPVPLAGTEVWICPGFAVTPEGDEVELCEPVCLDLASGKQDPHPCCDPWPCPPVGIGASPDGPRDTFTLWIAIRYAECLTRPVRVPPRGCGCDEHDCDYSRIRDSFEIRCLPALPRSHVLAAERDAAWSETWGAWREGAIGGQQRLPVPVPPCPDCPPDPWVVLATVLMRKPAGEPLRILAIRFDDRRVLLSTRALQTILTP